MAERDPSPPAIDALVASRFAGEAGTLVVAGSPDTGHFVSSAVMVIEAGIDRAKACGCDRCRRAVIGLEVARLALVSIPEAPTLASVEPVGRA